MLRYNDRPATTYEYSRDVMYRMDRDFDGRIGVEDPSLAIQTKWFMQAADLNQDRYVDQFELHSAIAYRVDTNLDQKVDEKEAEDAYFRYGLPLIRFF